MTGQPLKDHSQFGEQAAILDAFGWNADATVFDDTRGTTNRRLLDIGAWHPTDKSNSRALIELGWQAVLIEPTPGNMINMLRCCSACGDVPQWDVQHFLHGVKTIYEPWGERKNPNCPYCADAVRYGFNQQLTLIQAAVGTVPGIIQLWVSDDAISTSSATEHERWKEVGGYYGKIMIPAITLEMIATQFGGFDFWNIDAEGQSAELFLQALQQGYRPRCFCVEHDGRTTELLNVATAEGYMATLVNSTNIVVVRR